MTDTASPLDPMTMTLVNGWIEAEREAGMIPGVSDAQLVDIALDRVRHVLAGEVRWSEATPGDKAIWRGRARDVMRFDRNWRAREHQKDPFEDTVYGDAPAGGISARLRSRSERRYLNVWDTTVVRDNDDGGDGFAVPWAGYQGTNQSVRLFGNANVGNLRLTNLQVAGQFAGDEAAYVAEMYATATDFDGLVAVCDRVVVTLTVGNALVAQAPLRDLVHSIPVRTVIPTRQNFSVMLDMFASPNTPRRRFDPFELSIHLEGIRRRPAY